MANELLSAAVGQPVTGVGVKLSDAIELLGIAANNLEVR